MKNFSLTVATVICALLLISWGEKGHRAVAMIAENHLTPTTKAAIKKILGNETLADVSNFADEIRTNKRLKYTGAWHFINLPAGYSFEQFSNEVKTMKQDNVYKAILQFERDLKSSNSSNSQKATALKFIVHFIGDVHQPMHVSSGDDKGGNAITVKFAGIDDNLHGLWDSGLIEHQHITYKQMATVYDNATTSEINKWQNDDPMVWLWESYQVSSILYQEAAKSTDYDEQYYKEHLPVLESRIEKGGIRLAGVLNAIFDGR